MEQLSDEEQRLRLKKALTDSEFVPYLALGPLVVRIQAISDNLVYEVFPSSFPRDRQRVAVLLDAPEVNAWGRLKQVWFGNGRGYKRYGAADLDAESQELLKRVFKRLHELAATALQDSLPARSSTDSRQAAERRIVQKRARARTAEDLDLAQLLLDIASREAPASVTEAMALSEVFTPMAPAQIPIKEPEATSEPKGPDHQLLAATPSQ